MVKQSGGDIRVYSEPGRGTTFTIYLPRVEENGAVTVGTPAASATPRGSETILVVEDNAAVRQVAVRILEKQGYHVFNVDRAEDALDLARRHAGPIDLLVTDVVMPGMGGPALAERVRAARPTMKVLYMSGYPADVAIEHLLQAGASFIQKPLTADMLAGTVREVLDARA